MVLKKTDTSSHEMGESLRLTLGSFNFLLWQTRVLTDSIVTWATLVTNPGWDRSRNPNLRGISKIQSRPRRGFCTSSGVRRSIRSVGCARHNLQFHTVLRNLRSYLFFEVFVWTVSPFLIFGIWLLMFGTHHHYPSTRAKPFAMRSQFENIPKSERSCNFPSWKKGVLE